MSVSRRNLIKMLAGAAPIAALPKTFSTAKTLKEKELIKRIEPGIVKIKGPFEPTEESLRQYKYPEWFRDAKFGFWAHWGPQAVPRRGDWYARKMYMQGDPDYEDHLKRYGHPSKFGYKDIIPLWKAQRWDPEKLMTLYKKAGAKYFVSMGSHHDDFFLWNSKIHKWNAINYGPEKDIVSIWQQAAKKEGLPFGVSEHLAASFTWFQTSHGADKTGPMKGVPYDGTRPIYQDLYHGPAAPGDTQWYSNNLEWHREWLFSVLELVENYQPDLLYTDGPFPFGDFGRTMLANFYNTNLQKNNGKLEAIYTCKEPTKGFWVEDLERGVAEKISPHPWETDTSIGDWFYREGQKRKSATKIIQMLVDIVSKNGNLLINIVLTPEGDLDPDIFNTLEEIGRWNSINGEGIYGSRPWKIYGENPLNAAVIKSGSFNEDKLAYSGQDIRFTTQGDTLYAFCLGRPTKDISINTLGHNSNIVQQEVASVELLGGQSNIHWKQRGDALLIHKPDRLPVEKVPVTGFKIKFKAS